MSRCGVDAKYIDAFCGRTKSSVLEKYYLDYSPERLREIYDEARITVLDYAPWLLSRERIKKRGQ